MDVRQGAIRAAAHEAAGAVVRGEHPAAARGMAIVAPKAKARRVNAAPTPGSGGAMIARRVTADAPAPRVSAAPTPGNGGAMNAHRVNAAPTPGPGGAMIARHATAHRVAVDPSAMIAAKDVHHVARVRRVIGADRAASARDHRAKAAIEEGPTGRHGARMAIGVAMIANRARPCASHG